MKRRSALLCLKSTALRRYLQKGRRKRRRSFVALMVEKVDFDPVGRSAHMRKFPAPSCLDTGNPLGLVAGVGDEQQKIAFPPVDIVEIPLVVRGTVLVPLAA